MNTSKFQATIYDKNGSLAVGKNVTFNINGVFYTKQLIQMVLQALE